MRISDWSSDVCSSDLNTGWPCWGARRPVTSSRDLAGRTEGNNHGFYLHPVNFRAGVLRRLLCGLVGNAGVAHTADGGHERDFFGPHRWGRSVERRVGTEFVSTFRSRWSPSHEKHHTITKSSYYTHKAA